MDVHFVEGLLFLFILSSHWSLSKWIESTNDHIKATAITMQTLTQAHVQAEALLQKQIDTLTALIESKK